MRKTGKHKITQNEEKIKGEIHSQPERTPQPIEPEPEHKPEYEPIEEPTQKPNPQQNQRKRFLSLDEKRYVWSNPAKLPPEERRYIFRESAKKKISGIFVYLEVNQEGKPVDAGLVRTIPTLRIVDARVRQKGNRILMHPYSITIPEGFWQRWKTARTPQDRLRLTKALGLLTDKAVRKIDKIVLDIDTPFDIAKPKLLEIFQMLGITQGYELGRTKSGNLRAIIYLEDDLNAQKDFRKNLHIERAREMYCILVELFKRYGLELDRTFADRINHPVWLSFDRRFYQRDIKVSGTVRFFDLYRAVKKWQSQNQVWEVENMNLTQKFWGDKRASKGKKKIPIRLPAFIRNELKTTFDEDYKLSLWKKAVKSLYKGKGGRFLNFIMPAVGWAKHLNLDRHEVDRYLESFLSDRDPKKNEKDLKTAWRVARELEFNLPESKTEIKTRLLAEDLITLTEKAINFIAERGEVYRQEFLKEIFSGQEWLLYKVMGYLEKKGLVESFFQKGQGRGRPSKGYRLTEKAKELSTNLDTQGFEVGQTPILRSEPYPKTLEVVEPVIEKDFQIGNMNKLNYNNSLQGASLGVGGFIETTNLTKPVDLPVDLTKPVVYETISSSSSTSSSLQTQDEKVDTELNGYTHTEEIKIVFLRELQDEELLTVKELVSRYENPEGIELVLEVSGQRIETGLNVSKAITQIQEKLKGLGVEVISPPAEELPEETHPAVVPPEEVVPKAVPEEVVLPEVVLPEEVVPQTQSKGTPANGVVHADPPAEVVPPAKRTQETANNHRKTHEEKEELGELSAMANRQQEKLTAQALRERFLRERGHEIEEFIRRLPKELPTTQREFLEVMEKTYKEWKAWTGDRDYWYFYAESRKTWELHHFSIPELPILEIKQELVDLTHETPPANPEPEERLEVAHKPANEPACEENHDPAHEVAHEPAYEKTPPAPLEGLEEEEGLEEVPEEILREFLIGFGEEDGQQQKKKGIGIKGVKKDLETYIETCASTLKFLEEWERKITNLFEVLPLPSDPRVSKIKKELLGQFDKARKMLTKNMGYMEHTLKRVEVTLKRRKRVSNPMAVRIGYRAFKIWLKEYRRLTLQDLPDKKKKSGLEKFIKLVDEYLSSGHDPEEFMEILERVMEVQFARFINGKADLESLESLTPSDLVNNFAKYLPIALYDRIMAEHTRRTVEYMRELFDRGL